jgi:hypothetical protein
MKTTTMATITSRRDYVCPLKAARDSRFLDAETCTYLSLFVLNLEWPSEAECSAVGEPF